LIFRTSKTLASTLRRAFDAVCVFIIASILITSVAKADHLSNSQCYEYYECVLGEESALNECHDNDYLKEIGTNRDVCMRIAQHQCKVIAGIQGTGRSMTLSRPLNWYHRPSLLDHDSGVVALVDEDIRIYNYAGWNHCKPQYQGLRDFWCDPQQLRYPPEPWCDVLPNYNVNLTLPEGAEELLHPLRRELMKKIRNYATE